jgi:hypothetical protein
MEHSPNWTAAKVSLYVAHTARRLFKLGALTVEEYHTVLDRALTDWDKRHDA